MDRATKTRVPTQPIEPGPLGEGAGASPAPESSTGLGWWTGVLAAIAALAAAVLAARMLMAKRGVRTDRRASPLPEPVAATPPRRASTASRSAADRVEEEGATPATAAPGVQPSGVSDTGVTLTFVPSRAGVNLVTATVTGEVIVTNAGAVAAERIAVEARLISAHAGQDEEIRDIHGSPIARPVTPAFTLQPGEQRRIPTIVALPQGDIKALKAGARPMFVPLVVLTTDYRYGALQRRVGHAFAVGVERVDSAKLAPIWLDGNPRMHNQVAARVHGSPFNG